MKFGIEQRAEGMECEARREVGRDGQDGIRVQRSEVGDQMADDRGQKMEDGGLFVSCPWSVVRCE